MQCILYTFEYTADCVVVSKGCLEKKINLFSESSHQIFKTFVAISHNLHLIMLGRHKSLKDPTKNSWNSKKIIFQIFLGHPFASNKCRLEIMIFCLCWKLSSQKCSLQVFGENVKCSQEYFTNLIQRYFFLFQMMICTNFRRNLCGWLWYN